MAKSKSVKKNKKRDVRATSDKPTLKKDLPLTRDIPEIRQQVVSIDKHKREVLHEIWPDHLLHHVSAAESAIWRSFGTYGDALTPNEKEALKEIRQNLKHELEKLNIIYFRLKFWR